MILEFPPLPNPEKREAGPPQLSVEEQVKIFDAVLALAMDLSLDGDTFGEPGAKRSDGNGG